MEWFVHDHFHQSIFLSTIPSEMRWLQDFPSSRSTHHQFAPFFSVWCKMIDGFQPPDGCGSRFLSLSHPYSISKRSSFPTGCEEAQQKKRKTVFRFRSCVIAVDRAGRQAVEVSSATLTWMIGRKESDGARVFGGNRIGESVFVVVDFVSEYLGARRSIV